MSDRSDSTAAPRPAGRLAHAALVAALAAAACASPPGGGTTAGNEPVSAAGAAGAAVHAHGDTARAGQAADSMGMRPRMGPGMGMGMGAGGHGMMAPPTPEQLALGDSIFHGRAAGGTCFACHGTDAKGTALAPDLTDAEWLNGDGSPRFIMHTIMHGVPDPVRHPQPMPAMGGAALSHDQVRAVAAYVASLRPAAP